MAVVTTIMMIVCSMMIEGNAAIEEGNDAVIEMMIVVVIWDEVGVEFHVMMMFAWHVNWFEYYLWMWFASVECVNVECVSAGYAIVECGDDHC